MAKSILVIFAIDPTPSLFIMQIIILALLFSAANAVDCSTTGGSASCAAAENMAVSVMNHFNVFDSVDRLLLDIKTMI